MLSSYECKKYMDVSENSGFSSQIIHFNRVFHYKPSILGYPYFWKHPYEIFMKHLFFLGIFFKENSNMPLQHTPDPQWAVYGLKILSDLYVGVQVGDVPFGSLQVFLQKLMSRLLCPFRCSCWFFCLLSRHQRYAAGASASARDVNADGSQVGVSTPSKGVKREISG